MSQGGVVTELTYRTLRHAWRRGAERLVGMGIGPGSRVALFCENRPEWLQTWLAINAAEATVVPLERTASEADVRYAVETSEAEALVASKGAFATLSPGFRSALAARGVLLLGVEEGLPDQPDSAGLVGPRLPGSPDDRDPNIASLLFTSGTTGRPKGVLLSQNNLLFVARSTLGIASLRDHEQLLSVLPLHHIFEFIIELQALLAGSTITYLPTLTGEALVDTMRARRTTLMAGVPRIFDLLTAELERRVAARGPVAQRSYAARMAAARAADLCGIDLGRTLFPDVHAELGGRLRYVCSGGSALGAKTRSTFQALGVPVLDGYGLTESSPIVTAQRLGEKRGGNVGAPIPGVEVRVANPDSRGEGELLVRGPNVMQGYFRDPEATSEALRVGWLHTGDLGKINGAGQVLITGRLKDLIVTAAGKNVSPVEVEARYGPIVGVREYCVVGVHTGALGEEVRAAVVVDDSAFPPETTHDEKRRAIEARLDARAHEAELPGHLRVQRVHLVPRLPATSTLKIKRQEVAATLAREGRDNGAAPALDDVPPGAAPLVSLVQELAHERGGRRVALDSTLQFDLGLDSLARLELLSRAEAQAGVRLAPSAAQQITRVRDLLAAIEAARKAPASGELPRPALQLPPPPGPLASSVRLGLDRLTRELWEVDADGLEHVPPGAAIFCPNHESHLDTLFVAGALPRHRRDDLVALAKVEHFQAPHTRALLSLGRAIPVDRDGDVRSALDLASEALRRGHSLLIHPEGTRTRNGSLGPFRSGAARLALEQRVPLVPVKITGAFELYPETRALPRLFDWHRLRRLRVHVRFGPPLEPTPSGSAESLTEALRQAILSLGASPR